MEGLSAAEARGRLRTYGPNVLAESTHVPFVTRLIRKLVNPLIMLLLIAGALSASLGQIQDFIIILIITAVSILLDAYQEHQATGAAERLRKRVALTATVIREGKVEEILMRDVVPGDTILLNVGDIVPADAKISESRDLLIDESSLTGESFPRELQKGSAVFLGTSVVTGEAKGIVEATGSRTKFGKISTHLVAPRPKTEFERGITEFGLLLMRTAIVFGLFVFVAHVILARDVLSSLLFVTALAIGFAPELLPMVITINLSRGAQRMSRHGVIVKSLPSIENFGSMDILATDKTGTLTENKIILEKYEDLSGKKSDTVLLYGYLGSIFQSGFRGPMEEAILAHTDVAYRSWKRIDVLPFDFFRKRSSVIVARGGRRLLISRGAPEEIVKISRLSSDVRKKIMQRLDAYGKQGFRVLAVATKPVTAKKSYSAQDESALSPVGFMVFLDPPKKTVQEALTRLYAAGVGIKILTGDSDVVTAAICKKIGLPVDGIARDADVDKCTDEELRALVQKATIFARLNPDQKVSVLAALRANGHVVGYMGDGVNDAPALRAADIGISVNNAADVAKLSADIILLHKDLHVLLDGVREGRITFGNVLKYLKMDISSNFGNMVSVAIASVFLPFLPILPVQVLLNDLLYDTSQLSLAGDRVDNSFLVKPRRWTIGAIRKFMFVFGPISSVFDLITFVVLLTIFHATPQLFQTGWFLESIVTQTMIIFSIRSRFALFRTRPSRLFALSLLGIIALALILPFSPLAPRFSFVRPPPVFFVLLVAITASYMLLVEATKRWFYRKVDV